LTGDLDDFDVVLDEEGVLALAEHPRIGIAAQTTQSIEKDGIWSRRSNGGSRARMSASRYGCKPTKERQHAR